MKVKCTSRTSKGVHHALTVGALYEIIGIEAGDYRILDDTGEPYLFPANLFQVIEPTRPSDWVATSEDGAEYAYPAQFNEPGFWEDYHDRKADAVRAFARFLNERLRTSEVA